MQHVSFARSNLAKDNEALGRIMNSLSMQVDSLAATTNWYFTGNNDDELGKKNVLL